MGELKGAVDLAGLRACIRDLDDDAAGGGPRVQLNLGLQGLPKLRLRAATEALAAEWAAALAPFVTTEVDLFAGAEVAAAVELAVAPSPGGGAEEASSPWEKP